VSESGALLSKALFSPAIKMHLGRSDNKWMALNAGINGVTD